jgi:aminomethyltransferase
LPIGLGARDTLRLEKGYCLASHEFAGGRTPLEAGLEWTLHEDHDFVGRSALDQQRARGDYERLVGLLVEDRLIPRQGYRILREDAAVGSVTSGTMSPSLKKGIALGYVSKDAAAAGTRLGIEVRGQSAASTVVKLPFL